MTFGSVPVNKGHFPPANCGQKGMVKRARAIPEQLVFVAIVKTAAEPASRSALYGGAVACTDCLGGSAYRQNKAFALQGEDISHM